MRAAGVDQADLLATGISPISLEGLVLGAGLAGLAGGALGVVLGAGLGGGVVLGVVLGAGLGGGVVLGVALGTGPRQAVDFALAAGPADGARLGARLAVGLVAGLVGAGAAQLAVARWLGLHLPGPEAVTPVPPGESWVP